MPLLADRIKRLLGIDSREKNPSDKAARQLVSPTPATAGYTPTMRRRWLAPRDLPVFTLHTIDLMMLDPTIRLGLAMRSAPLCAAEWAYKEGEEWKPGVKADRPEVAEYVERQLNHLWKFHIAKLLRAQIWGWAAAEVMYRYDAQTQSIEVEGLLGRKAQDCRALEQESRLVGVRFLHIGRGLSGNIDLRIPKAFWHAHNPEAESYYGESILLGAYSPWADKWLDGGALDVRRLFMYKDSYGGQTMYYPSGTTNIEGKGEVPNRDIARELVEQAEAGSVVTMPSQYDPQSCKRTWEHERADVPSNPQHILQYPQDLDVEMLRGMQIPDDVLTSEGTGAWQGKQVPQLAFYKGLDQWMATLVGDVCRQILEPAVYWNFGAVDFEVCWKPLALQAAEQNQTQRSAPGQGQSGGGGEGFPFMQQGPQQMGLNGRETVADYLVGSGVLEAGKLVEAARRNLNGRATRLAQFNEEDHPRNESGEFAPKNGRASRTREELKSGLSSFVEAFQAVRSHSPKDAKAIKDNIDRIIREKDLDPNVVFADDPDKPDDRGSVAPPEDWGTLSKGEKGAVVASLMEMPMRSLRTMQDRLDEVGGGDRQVENAQIARRLVDAAVDAKAFGDKDFSERFVTLQPESLSDLLLSVQAIKRPLRMAVVHAPKGGVTIAGKEYAGGEFIPGDALASASDEELAELKPARRGAMAETKRVETGEKNKKGEPLTELQLKDGPLPDHLKNLRIPPAWTNVEVSTDPGADLVATGFDAKGRKQSVYSDSFAARQAALKFSRIRELRQKQQAIAAQNMENLKAGSEPAAVAALILATGLRPGSDRDTKAEKQAFGATTLRAEHVKQTKDGVRLQFTGKKGVPLDIPVNDPEVASMLVARAQKDGRLFEASDSDLRKYVKTLDGGSFKPKDFRTLKGTSLAAQQVSGEECCKTEKEYKKRVREVAKVVSQALGNTPTIALQSYIDPTVFSKWRPAA